MGKALRCILRLHLWRTMHNDEGARYELCDLCGAYREPTGAAGSIGSGHG